ncbi:MAG: class I SAM-dependent methyltransferase [Planctomycetes bacterium]|nr:class I SAM-dependent methyltransferase [Planctomycetota bacterium]MCC7399640.1 class I SAM-dependent methyltransferase [Planctomycetota bacterium]
MTAPDRSSAAHWNERYAGEPLLFGDAPNVWLQEHEALLPRGGRVLCVADGDGRNSVWLAQRGHRVEAFDFAEVAVQKARRFAAARGVHVDHHVAAVEAWAWREDAYDAVVAIFIQFLAPAARQRVFEKMAAALRPGGVLVLQGYTPQQLAFGTGGPSAVENLYPPELVRAAFAGLEVLALSEYEAELQEGAAHRGRSALLGLVARRPR